MDSFSDVFSHVKELISNEITDVSFNLWIKPIEPIKFEGDTAFLYVKSEYQKGILNDKYLNIIKNAFNETMGFDVDISILCETDTDDSQNYTENKPESAPKQDSQDQKNTEKINIENFDRNYEFTFDTFIVGKSNDFAYAACRAIAEKKTSYINNPLFIYGPSGLGKTHLLLAISDYVKKQNPDTNIILINAEAFANEFIHIIRSGGNHHSFQQKYRTADILLIDDIQFFAGKEAIQEEFFHTFNELYQMNKQIILTSDRPPKDIKTLEDRLRTRFEWGLLTDIQLPDVETRIAIIKRKAELLQIDIPNDVAEYISNKLKSNIRQLEGAVKKLKANKIYTGASPSIAVAQNVIRDILNDNQPTTITVERIINEVSRTFNVSPENIKSQKRAANISLARQAAIYIVREISQLSLESIGKEFGNRDHATISYTLKKVEEQMAKNSHQKEIINDLITNIRDK